MTGSVTVGGGARHCVNAARYDRPDTRECASRRHRYALALADVVAERRASNIHDQGHGPSVARSRPRHPFLP